jgi:hypothetical protein
MLYFFGGVMIYNPEDYVFQLGNTDLNTALNAAINNANQRREISHYTNLDALLCMLKTKTLKLNRIDRVNDLNEKLYINDQNIINQVFIACFTNRISEFIPHWFMYSKDVYGIRVTFVKQKGHSIEACMLDPLRPIKAFFNGEAITTLNSLSDDHRITPEEKNWAVEYKTLDVVYNNKLMNQNPVIRQLGVQNKIDLLPVGSMKTDDWSFENETRIVGLLRPKTSVDYIPVADYLLMPVTFERLDKIIITCGPWMTEDLKDTIKEICEKYLKGFNYSVKKSVFEKLIKR